MLLSFAHFSAEEIRGGSVVLREMWLDTWGEFRQKSHIRNDSRKLKTKPQSLNWFRNSASELMYWRDSRTLIKLEQLINFPPVNCTVHFCIFCEISEISSSPLRLNRSRTRRDPISKADNLQLPSNVKQNNNIAWKWTEHWNTANFPLNSQALLINAWSFESLKVRPRLSREINFLRFYVCTSSTARLCFVCS